MGITDLSDGRAELVLPPGIENRDWQPKNLYPIEIIDGQHRLLGFDESEALDGAYDLPVVLFQDLDISWQAYLFWTINISPKRIGPSLAYDLFPLLRTQDWLENEAGPLAYREARAQELTEALWSHPDSPWFERIGMLGRERGKVTQAAFIRSLTVSFLRRSDSRGGRPGGLFGAALTPGVVDVLPWSRAQQAAFLIYIWQELERGIADQDPEWAVFVRERTHPPDAYGRDAAFSGTYSLLATDQGVRGVLHVANDVSYALANESGLREWRRDEVSDATDTEEVGKAIQELQGHQSIATYVKELARFMALFDWRSFATPQLVEAERNKQALYRAGSGYREVRRQLLLFLAEHAGGQIQSAAQFLVTSLGYHDDEG